MSNLNNTADRTKIAIVTGGSRGIGRSVVLNLAKHGVHSIFTYNSQKQAAEEVVREVAKIGAKAAALQLDTASIGSFNAFTQSVRATLGSLGTEGFDFLVNNAGTGFHKEFDKVTEEEFDSQWNVHVKGVYFLTQKLLPLMNDGGRIVNVSSGLTRMTFPGAGTYAMMKGAVEVFTRYLAKELGERGIAANTVAPGAIATDFNGGRTRDNPELNKRVAENTALGRAGLPEDIGPMIASLLSGENGWINAQRIEVSGGMVI